jgi:DNA polymerase
VNDPRLLELGRGLAATLRRRRWLAGDLRVPPPPAPPQPAPPPEASAPLSPEVRAQHELAASCAELESLRRAVAACTACPLSRTRTQTVFGDGAARARVMFIGEAPGEVEDREGLPFVGPAGALLSDIIRKGMGLRREEVAIANVLKCRPPSNRDPLPEEQELCTPFLDRQIELVAPEILVLLGRHAAQHVLGSSASLGRLRGRIHERRGRKAVATYHPAYLLRTPAAKKDCWQDIQLVMRELGLALPKDRRPASGA